MGQILLVVTFILTVCPAAPANAGDDAATVYANRCAFCHGTTGRGDGPAGMALKPPPPNFANPEYWKSADPDAMNAIVANGKPGTSMIAFKGILSAAEITALVEHLKGFDPAR